MFQLPIELVIGIATALPLLLAYWVARAAARRKLARCFREPRPWQMPLLRGWAERGWLIPELAETLPADLPPAELFYEWAWVDPDAARSWRFSEAVRPDTPNEALVHEVWSHLTAEEQVHTRERLAEALVEAGAWWGGAERGWNRRPLAVMGANLPRKKRQLPLLPLDDLTAAPLAAALRVEAMAREAEGPDLVVALALLRRASPRWTHPLAPSAGSTASMVEGVSVQIGTDVGRRVGAGLGAVLGPIGSMVGQYLGGMAGTLGGKALAQQSLPEPVAAALKETESALARLGEAARKEDLAAALRQPADAIVEAGGRLDLIRTARNRRLRERIWPSPGLALVEEAERAALEELRDYREAAEVFAGLAKAAPPAVAGGMVLQNPWLVRRLPGTVELLNAARGTLNRSASLLRRRSG
jgi:hypothetical protein